MIAATPRWGDWFLPFWPIAEDRLDYLRAMRPLDPIERIGDAAPAAVLFQFGRHDFFIAAMTGLEFRRAAPDGAELIAYDAEHDMRDSHRSAADRLAFLARHLDLAGSRRPRPDGVSASLSVPAATSAVSRMSSSSKPSCGSMTSRRRRLRQVHGHDPRRPVGLQVEGRPVGREQRHARRVDRGEVARQSAPTIDAHGRRAAMARTPVEWQ